MVAADPPRTQAPRSPWLDKPTLVGELVTLRPYRPEDLDLLRAAMADPEVSRLTGGVHSTALAQAPSVDTEEELLKLRAWYSTRNTQDDRLDLMVVDNATRRTVGEVVLNKFDAGSGTCNYRIFLGPAGRDRGLGTEAARLIIDYAFTHLPLHRIDLEVYAFNPRAQRSYEKAGFVVEGRRREALKFDDQRIDAIIMGLLRPDWAAGRG